MITAPLTISGKPKMSRSAVKTSHVRALFTEKIEQKLNLMIPNIENPSQAVAIKQMFALSHMVNANYCCLLSDSSNIKWLTARICLFSISPKKAGLHSKTFIDSTVSNFRSRPKGDYLNSLGISRLYRRSSEMERRLPRKLMETATINFFCCYNNINRVSENSLGVVEPDLRTKHG